MKISPVNTNMVYNNRNCKKPAFQAKVEESLLHELRFQAAELNIGPVLENQLARLSQWGNRASTLCISADAPLNADHFSSSHLALTNEKISTLYGGGFDNIPKSKKILEQFFMLKEQDILDAEKEITETSRLAKLEAVKKIVQNPEYMEEITGKPNPSDKELEKGIKKLSEKQLMEYRFESLRKLPEPSEDELDVIHSILPVD